MRTLLRFSLLGVFLLLSGCASFQQVKFPPQDEVFITTGDGDITKPYEPIGQLIYAKKGVRIPLPLIGLIPISDAVAGTAINEIIAKEARAMGGNAVINLDIKWTSPRNGLLGLGADGGAVFIQGTVIKR